MIGKNKIENFNLSARDRQKYDKKNTKNRQF